MGIQATVRDSTTTYKNFSRMKFSLLIFCLVFVSFTDAQGCSIIEGYYRGNIVVGPIQVPTLTKCQVLCFQKPTCIFWEYSREYKWCTLRTERKGEILYKVDKISGNKACGGP